MAEQLGSSASASEAPPGFALVVRCSFHKLAQLNLFRRWRLRRAWERRATNLMWLPLQGEMLRRKDAFGYITAFDTKEERELFAEWVPRVDKRASLERHDVRADGWLERPVILLSAPRSGSTVVFETLARLPDIWTIGGESHRIIESSERLRPEGRGFESHRLEAEDCGAAVARRLRTGFAAGLRDRDGNLALATPPGRGAIFVEKTPRNALRLPFLRALFPGAKILFLIREPRGNVSSLMEAWMKWPPPPVLLPGWKAGSAWGRGEWKGLLVPGWRSVNGRSLEEICALQWRSANETILSDLEALPRADWLPIDYGRFVDEPQAEVRRIAEFLGASLDEQALRVVGSPLRPSHAALSAPKQDKWKRNADAIARILPSVEPLERRLQAVLAS